MSGVSRRAAHFSRAGPALDDVASTSQPLILAGARGFMSLRPRAQGIALGFSLRCEGQSWQGLTERLSTIVAALGAAADVASLARAVLPLVSHLELRVPSASAHREAMTNARAALQGLALYREVSDAIGAAQAEAATLLLLGIDDLLSSEQREALQQLTPTHSEHPALAAESSNVRAQLSGRCGLTPAMREWAPRCSALYLHEPVGVSR